MNYETTRTIFSITSNVNAGRSVRVVVAYGEYAVGVYDGAACVKAYTAMSEDFACEVATITARRWCGEPNQCEVRESR